MCYAISLFIKPKNCKLYITFDDCVDLLLVYLFCFVLQFSRLKFLCIVAFMLGISVSVLLRPRVKFLIVSFRRVASFVRFTVVNISLILSVAYTRTYTSRRSTPIFVFVVLYCHADFNRQRNSFVLSNCIFWFCIMIQRISLRGFFSLYKQKVLRVLQTCQCISYVIRIGFQSLLVSCVVVLRLLYYLIYYLTVTITTALLLYFSNFMTTK